MQIRELRVPHSWEITPRQFTDDRGVFLEWFKDVPFADAVGHELRLAQANCSVSRRGVLRGVHYADVPPGQAKYVTCTRGAVLDVVVDIRMGSPSFGAWDSSLLDDEQRRAVYVAEGIGHAFLALTDGATVTYLCSEGYAPEREHELNPLDPAIGIAWPADIAPVLSAKDAGAPDLSGAREHGLLPSWDACLALYASHAEGSR